MNKLTTNLMVTNVNETIDYYVNNLGFTFITSVDEEKESVRENYNDATLIWAMIKNGGVEIMLQRVDSLTEELPIFTGKETGATLTLYISMKDVEGFYHDIKDKVDIVRDLNKTFYGANEFVIKDPNQYIICFGEMMD